MTIRVTVLCDNNVAALSGTLGEHGFAALLEPAEGEPLLFDTGQGFTLLHNARRMNLDLSLVRKIVISHGHYDHTGGLLSLLHECGPKEIYAHEGIFADRYRVKESGACHPIGIPVEQAALETSGAVFNLSAAFREIAPQIFLTGEVPRVTPFERGDQGIYSDCKGETPDFTPDDQSLVIATEKGLLVLLGCCHSGLVNTLEHIACHTGRRDIYAIVGGTHLGFCDQEQLDRTVAAIKRVGIRKLAVSHCTGFGAAARLARELPQAFRLATVGYTLEV